MIGRDQINTDSGSLLMDIADLAREIKVSERHVRRLAISGKLPPPVRLGRSVRWRRADVERWVAAKCPDEKTFLEFWPR